MLAVLRQGESAYAPEVAAQLADQDRAVSRGALYRTFDRLEAKGFLRWKLESAQDRPIRGGMPLRRFSVTDRGLAALRESRETLLALWSGLEKRLRAR